MDREYALGFLLNKEFSKAVIDFNKEYWQKEKTEESLPILDLLRDKNPNLLIFKADKKLFFSFENQVDRLALMSQDEFNLLVTYLGACVFNKEISAVVLKKERERLLNSISLKIYDFVLDYSRFALDLSFVKNDLGIAFSFNKENFQKAGFYVFSLLFSNFSSQFLINSIKEKLDFTFDANIKHNDINLDNLFHFVSKILKEEIDARWIKYLD